MGHYHKIIAFVLIIGGLLAIGLVTSNQKLGALPAEFEGIIQLSGKKLNDCKSMRTSMYSKYSSLGEKYSAEDMQTMLSFRDVSASALSFDPSTYLFDMYSCAFIPQDMVRQGKVRAYRTYLGL